MYRRYKVSTKSLFRATAIGALALAAALTAASDARAVTLQECGVQYRVAQAAGTLAGKKWKEYRTSECGLQAGALPAAPSRAAGKKEDAPVTSFHSPWGAPNSTSRSGL